MTKNFQDREHQGCGVAIMHLVAVEKVKLHWQFLIQLNFYLPPNTAIPLSAKELYKDIRSSFVHNSHN